MDDFTVRLKKYIDFAYNNGKSFIKEFWYDNDDELLDFYMADTSCKVFILTSSQDIVSTTISTIDFLDWYNKLNGEKLK